MIAEHAIIFWYYKICWLQKKQIYDIPCQNRSWSGWNESGPIAAFLFGTKLFEEPLLWLKIRALVIADINLDAMINFRGDVSNTPTRKIPDSDRSITEEIINCTLELAYTILIYNWNVNIKFYYSMTSLYFDQMFFIHDLRLDC